MAKRGFDFTDPDLQAALSKVTTALGFLSWEPSEWDGRKIIGELANGHHGILHLEPVDSANAQAYRSWVAMSKPGWGRVAGIRPDNYESFTVMIGRAPDDRWWWIQAFRDDLLKDLIEQVHWVRPGFGRLADSTAAAAAVTPLYDLLQTTLFDEQPCNHGTIEAVLPDGWACADCGVAFGPTEPALSTGYSRDYVGVSDDPAVRRQMFGPSAKG
jgi:hypothetical protein